MGCFLPSDHHIKNNKKFIQGLLKASKIALNNKLVILGLKSKEPNINYGYIKYKKNYVFKDSFEVDSFIEKPKKLKAISLHRQGALWNSGIVIVKNNYLKSLFNQFNKKLYSLVRKSCAHSIKDMEFIFLDKKDWNQVSSISFDYAILEKEFKQIVVQLDIIWSDLGTFESIYKIKKSIGNVESINTENCFSFSNIA